MNPFLLFLLAILAPIALAITFLLPIYLGIISACYYIYYKSTDAVHPLADKLYDVFYMFDVYNNLIKQWTQHIDQMSFVSYSMPLLGLPIFCGFFAFWLTAKLARKLKDIFQTGVSM